MNSEVAALVAQLTSLAVRNTAAFVADKIRTVRARNSLESQVNQLNDINELLDDRAQLVGIAQGLQGELVAQRISVSDIAYINGQLQLSSLGGAIEGEGREALTALKTLMSVEMLTVLQLVGFNYKRAIGEPLTDLVASMVRGVRPTDPDPRAVELGLEREVLYLQAARHPESWARGYMGTPSVGLVTT